MHDPSPTWTGRFEFDLTSGGGPALATVEVSVRIDLAILWIGTRTVAVIDRDQFRDWLHHPHHPLQVDDLRFQLFGNDLAVSVDDSAPFPLSAETTRRLITYI